MGFIKSFFKKIGDFFKRIFHRDVEEIDDEEYDDDEVEYDDYDEEERKVINEDKNLSVHDSSRIKMVPIEDGRSASRFIGNPTQIDVIAPASISIDDDANPDTVLINESGSSRLYAQPFYVPPAGYPYQLGVNTFLGIINHGWIDATIDIYPKDNAVARRDLKQTQTIIEGNLLYQQEKGMQFQLRDNIIKDQSIEGILNGIQTQTNGIMYIILTFLVYGDNPNELQQHCDEFVSEMANNGFTVQKLVGQTKSGLMETIPFGVQADNLDHALRIMDRVAGAKLDFAQNASGKFNEGIPIGYNRSNNQRQLEWLNLFGTEYDRPDNYNMGIVGQSGSGKSAFVKNLIFRSIVAENYHIRTIDPEREYVKLAHTLGQLNLDFSADSDLRINPCKLSIAEKPTNVLQDVDRFDSSQSDVAQLNKLLMEQKVHRDQIVTHDGEHYIRYVPIQSKINQIIDFVKQIYAADFNDKYVLTPEERNILSDAIKQVFDNLGITSDPASLYTGQEGFVDGEYVDNTLKPEPTLSDIVAVIREKYYDGQEDNSPAERLLSVLSPYLRDGSIPIFDGQTYFGPSKGTDLDEYQYINFNISELQGSFKEVAAYVITQLNWNNWVINPMYAEQKKLLVIDEILQLIQNPVFGSLAEVAIRQARKFNAGMIWLAQDLGQIKNDDRFRALISNSNFFMYMHIKEAERQIVQNLFNLNDGVMDKLCSKLDKGEGIMVQPGSQTWIQNWMRDFDIENFAESNEAKARERNKRRTNSVEEINAGVNKDRHLAD